MTPPKPDLVAIRARLTFAINKRAASLMIDTDALSALLAYAERLEKRVEDLEESMHLIVGQRENFPEDALENIFKWADEALGGEHG